MNNMSTYVRRILALTARPSVCMKSRSSDAKRKDNRYIIHNILSMPLCFSLACGRHLLAFYISTKFP